MFTFHCRNGSSRPRSPSLGRHKRSQNQEKIKPGFLILYRWDYEDRTPYWATKKYWKGKEFPNLNKGEKPYWSNHIAIVTGIDKNFIYTIEPNDVGDKRGIKQGETEPQRLGTIKRMRIPRNDHTINGFINPTAFPSQPQTKPHHYDPSPTQSASLVNSPERLRLAVPSPR